MSFASKPITLPRTPARDHKLRLCDKCGMAVDPEGGVNVTHAKWVCALCWLAIFRKVPK